MTSTVTNPDTHTNFEPGVHEMTVSEARDFLATLPGDEETLIISEEVEEDTPMPPPSGQVAVISENTLAAKAPIPIKFNKRLFFEKVIQYGKARTNFDEIIENAAKARRIATGYQTLMEEMMEKKVYFPNDQKEDVTFFFDVYGKQQDAINKITRGINIVLQKSHDGFKTMATDLVISERDNEKKLAYLCKQKNIGYHLNQNMLSNGISAMIKKMLYDAERESLLLSEECYDQIAAIWPQTLEQFLDLNEVREVFKREKISIVANELDDCAICKVKKANLKVKEMPNDLFACKERCKCPMPKLCNDCMLEKIWRSYVATGKYKTACDFCKKLVRLDALVVVEVIPPPPIKKIVSKKRKSNSREDSNRHKKGKEDAATFEVGNVVKYAAEETRQFFFVVDYVEKLCCKIKLLNASFVPCSSHRMLVANEMKDLQKVATTIEEFKARQNFKVGTIVKTSDPKLSNGMLSLDSLFVVVTYSCLSDLCGIQLLDAHFERCGTNRLASIGMLTKIAEDFTELRIQEWNKDKDTIQVGSDIMLVDFEDLDQYRVISITNGNYVVGRVSVDGGQYSDDLPTFVQFTYTADEIKSRYVSKCITEV